MGGDGRGSGEWRIGMGMGMGMGGGAGEEWGVWMGMMVEAFTVVEVV